MGWNRQDMGDLSGRTAVVTGANSGLGLESARALAAAGPWVLLACRDPERACEAAWRRPRRRSPPGRIGSTSSSTTPG